ncbi:SRPBCC domain-containing protein [Paradesertivirga mongoliensis]|uniref:SRPBCC domain-containing protein n=1 Tax=Paradesertivirga mongoliensis TaxID=2100740 RepID=A0ABW4ZMX2_9SPHI|nr:SRPBCC domain-containing protein [Pedobacter mongoliensis]
MNRELAFDWRVNKETRTEYYTREFAAKASLVWDAFTKADLIDRWYAPRPVVSNTKEMDFTVGGRRLYAISIPGGKEFWSVEKYTAITLKTDIQYKSAFSDKDGNVSSDSFGSESHLVFTDTNGITTLKKTVQYTSLEAFERMIGGNHQDGMAECFNNLDELLIDLNK